MINYNNISSDSSIHTSSYSLSPIPTSLVPKSITDPGEKDYPSPVSTPVASKDFSNIVALQMNSGIVHPVSLVNQSPALELDIAKCDIMQVLSFQVSKNPNAVAATYQSTTLSYAELDKKSTQLANYLTTYYDIGPNVPIVIIGNNKLDMLISELAILKAGAAFVPFESDIPQERLAVTLKNTQMKLIIACGNSSQEVATKHTDCPVLNLEQNKEKIAQESYSALEVAVNDTDLAYILYTSGSTSTTPKGVMQTRGGLLGQIKNYTENLSLNSKDNFLQLAPFSHDQAIVDTYGALLNGAGLHLYNLNMKNFSPEKTLQDLCEKKISIFSSIPSVFSLIFEKVTVGSSFPDLRIITLGGEAVKTSHVKLYQKIASPHCLFINGYGATEFSWLSYFVITKYDPMDQLEQIPLGLMASGTEVFLDLQASDLNGVGELCVHSKVMSPGYWNNPEATKKAFFELDQKMYYRTGDLASVSNNIYFFKGRLNWHDKINGKRVNLKDVEDCMLKNLPIKQCVVMVYGEDLNKKLYAFYTTANQGESINESEIRIQLRSHLKGHEIPAKFFLLERFPLLPNAKVNRQELKSFLEEGIHQRKLVRNKNASNLLTVDRLISEILDLGQPLEKDENFFNSGMSSLDISLLANRLNEALSKYSPPIEISIPEIYESCTTRKLTDLIDRKYFKTDNGLQTIPEYKLVDLETYEYYPNIYIDTEYKSLIFNYDSLKILADFYNHKYGISIFTCESKEVFMQKVKEFLRKGETGQIGFTIPRYATKDSHATPAILSVNRDGASLFISDSFGVSEKAALELATYFCKPLLDKKLPIKLYIENTGRQTDSYSCFIDALLFLKNGLRLNMPSEIKEIKIIEGTDFHLFQSPKEIIKNGQDLDLLPSLTSSMDSESPLKTSKSNTSLTKFFARNIREVECTEKENQCNRILIKKNVSFYKKNEKFIKILQSHNAREMKT